MKWTRSRMISQLMPYTSVFVLNVKKSKDSRAIQRTGNILWFVGEIGKVYFQYNDPAFQWIQLNNELLSFQCVDTLTDNNDNSVLERGGGGNKMISHCLSFYVNYDRTNCQR